MAVSCVREVVEQIKRFSTAEKLELLRSLIEEEILQVVHDEFSEEEIAEIEAAIKEANRGEWVDFDEFRKTNQI